MTFHICEIERKIFHGKVPVGPFDAGSDLRGFFVAERSLHIPFQGERAVYLHVIQSVTDDGARNQRKYPINIPISGFVVQICMDVAA